MPSITIRNITRSLAVLAPILAVACSAPGSGSGGGAGTGGGTSSGGTSSGGTGPGTGSGSGGPPSSSGPVAVPFLVSDQFVPSGFMGDSPTDFNAVKMTNDAASCPGRDASAKGICYSVHWTPTPLAGAKSAWVGVYWQYPANNWGAKPGKAISAGAKKVSFLAKGAAGGEAVTFLAGGINGKATDPTLTNSDSFSVHSDMTLTTEWTRYEISLAGQTYSSVIGAFAWSMTTSSTTPVAFYVDDIAWE